MEEKQTEIQSLIFTKNRIEIIISDDEEFEKSKQWLEYSFHPTEEISSALQPIARLKLLHDAQTLIKKEISRLGCLLDPMSTEFSQEEQILIRGSRS